MAVTGRLNVQCRCIVCEAFPRQPFPLYIWHYLKELSNSIYATEYILLDIHCRIYTAPKVILENGNIIKYDGNSMQVNCKRTKRILRKRIYELLQQSNQQIN